jgi:hypothetical protein
VNQQEAALKQSSAAPRVFISYAWEARDHKQWIKELAVKLRLDGVELLLDQWELAPGDQVPEFMEKSIRESEIVIVVCTPTYKAKSDSRTGGVGYEGTVMTAELASGAKRRKFIPLLRRGEWQVAAPSWIAGSFYLDFRSDGVELEDVYRELLQTLHGVREKAPPVGSPPLPKESSESPDSARDNYLGSTSSLPNENATEIVRMLDRGAGNGGARQNAQTWLESDFGNRSWPYVWDALMSRYPDDAGIRHMGLQWLAEGDQSDRAWPHVWHALRNKCPDDPWLEDIGRAWLVQVDRNHPGWPYVWNNLMNASPNDSLLRELGSGWLRERRHG